MQMQSQPRSLSPMWHRTREVFLFAGIELLLFFPVILVTFLKLSPVSLPLWIGLFWLSYYVGSLISLIKVRRVVWLHLFILMMSGLLVWLMFAGIFNLMLVLSWIMIYYLMYRGANMSSQNWHLMFPSNAFIIGLISYFVVSVGAVIGAVILSPYLTLLLWTGLASIIVSLLSVNQQYLTAVSPKGFKTSAVIAKKNRLWVLFLIGIIFFISFVNVLKNLVMTALQGLGWLAQEIFSLLETAKNPEASMPPPPMEFSMQSEIQESIWSTILSVLFYVIGTIVALVIIGWLLYKIVPILRQAIIRFMGIIRKLISQENKLQLSSGYTDQKRQLLKWEDMRSSFNQGLRKSLNKWFRRGIKWSDLSNWQERVRWLYRNKLQEAINKGYMYRKELTPRETLDDIRIWNKREKRNIEHELSLEHYYNEARYGNSNITVSDEQVNELKRAVTQKVE